MPRTLRTSIVLSTLALLAAIAPVGCSNPGPGRTDATTASMTDTRDMLLKGGTQLETLMTSAMEIGKSTDYKKSFEKFSSALKGTDEVAAKIRERWTSLKSKSEEYAKAWQDETALLSTPESRQIADSRRKDFNERIAGLQKSFGELKDAYDPFVAQMGDIKVLLANDLTAGGIAAAAPMLQKAVTSANGVRTKLGATEKVLAEMVSLGATKALPATK